MMKLLRLFAFLLFLLSGHLHAQSALSRLGEFKVNTTTSGDQTNPRMAMDAQGNFVVVWESSDSSGLGIWAQRYNAACSPVGSEFAVNTQTANDQRFPSVSMAPDGRFVVVWETADGGGAANGIKGRLYDAGGNSVMEFTGSGAEAGELHHPSVAMDHDGRFTVAWRKGSGSGNEWVWAQQFSASGTPVRSAFQTYPGFPAAYLEPSVAANASGDFIIVWYADVADIPGSQVPTQGVFARGYRLDGTTKFGPIRVSPVEETINNKPSVAMRDDGSFVVAWNQTPNVNGIYDVYCRRFDASGTALDGNKVLVNTATGGNQDRASVSLGPNGEFDISYYSDGFDGNGLAVVLQRFNANGSKVADEFFANTFTTGNQQPTWANGAHAFDSNGNLVLVWQSAAQDGSGTGIYADKFYLSNQGPPLSEFRVNTTTVAAQIDPAIASDAVGNFVVVWTTAGGGVGQDIFAQRYSAAGLRIGAEFRVNVATNANQITPAIACAPDGRFVVVWQSDGTPAEGGLYARIFAADGTGGSQISIPGTSGASVGRYPAVAMDSNANFVVAWAGDGRDGDSTGNNNIYALRYTNTGSVVGSELRVNTSLTGDQTLPSIARQGNGDFIVTWRHYPDASTLEIKGRRYDNTGSPKLTAGSTDEFSVNIATPNAQAYSSVTVNDLGQFMVAYDSEFVDGSSYGILVRKFDAAGNGGGETLVNTVTQGSQNTPSIAMNASGAYALAWQSYNLDGDSAGIAFRRFRSNDADIDSQDARANLFSTGVQTTAATGAGRALALDAVGNVMVVWQSDGQDGSGYGIYATKVFLYPEATVTTNAASPVTDTSATLNGTVNAHGDTATVSIDYGTTTALGTTVSLNAVTGTSDMAVSTGLTGLLPGTTYYFRVRASSSGREVLGQTLSFTTTVLPPIVSLPVQTARTDTTATLDVTVNPKGAVTTVLVEYSVNPGGPFTQSAAQNCGSGQANVVKTFNLSGLTASSTYTVRARATNSAGPTTSADTTFTTTGKPGVTTNTATSVTKISALLNGAVNPFGIAGTAFFEYGTSPSYGQSTPSQSVGSGTTDASVQAAISGLQPNTTYHFRVVGVNGAGGTNGNDVSFTTDPDPPVAVTAAPANVTNSTATLKGAVIPLSRSTNAYFEWGPTALYGSVTATQVLPAGSTAVNLEANLSGLSSGGTYHYRVVGTNSGGTAFGDDQMFVATNGGGGGGATAAPTVTTGGTTGRTATTATLQGSVNPNSGSTTAYFEYGATASYGQTTTPQNLGNGASPVNTSAPVGGLIPAKMVHYRLVAINDLGTTNGDDATFSTEPPPAPTVQGGSASVLTQVGATLSGKVNPNGGETTAQFEYGLTTDYGSLSAVQNIGSGSSLADVSAVLSGLTAGTQYHFRLIATNAGGTTNGTDGTFTTAPPPPTVTNVTPSPIGATFATLKAKVHPHGKATTAYFEYGTTNSYGTRKAAQDVGSGDAEVDLSEPLTGLVAGQEYHFRVVATSSQGTTTGDDATFTTSPAQDPEAVTDFLFVGSLVTPASRNLLANDVNHDYPTTTNQDLSFVTFLLGRTLPIVAQGSVAGDGNVTYTRFSTFKFDTANFPPNPSDVFGYRITTPAGKTSDGQVKIYHFGSFKGSFGGIIRGGTQDDGGAISLELASSGDFTMKLAWQGIDYSSKPQLNGAGQLASGTGTLPIPKRNSAVPGKNLVLKLQLQPDGSIPGTLEDQETQKTFTFTLRRAGLATDDDPKAQQFTATMDQLPLALAEGAPFAEGVTFSENAPRGSITPQQVTGFGFYLAKLSKARNKLNARFTGGMPDREKISSGSKVYGDRVLLGQRLYKKGRLYGGRVFGESTLVRRATFTSTLEWIKKTGGLFGPPPPTVVPRTLPFDFHNALSLAGDSYQKTGDLPPAQRFIMDFGSTLEVRFSAGGLAAEQTALFTLRQSGAGFKVIAGDTTFAKKPTFKVNVATGMFSGTFVHPDTQRYKKPLPFSGAFRRNPDASYDVNEKGRGSFLGFDNAGFVRVFKATP